METSTPRTLGFDTGFFHRVVGRDETATHVWADVRAGRALGTVSFVTLFELDRLGLRGVLPKDVAEGLVDALPATCRVVWLSEPGPLRRAARLAHGIGLAMADALILSSLLDAGAETVYTTDSDFERYDGPTRIVVL